MLLNSLITECPPFSFASLIGCPSLSRARWTFFLASLPSVHHCASVPWSYYSFIVWWSNVHHDSFTSSMVFQIWGSGLFRPFLSKLNLSSGLSSVSPSLHWPLLLFFKIVNQGHLFRALLVSHVSRISCKKSLTVLLISQVSTIACQKSLTVLLISLRM